MKFFARALPCSLLFAVFAAPHLLQAQTAPPFAAYNDCKFEDGLTVTELTHVPSGVQGRTVNTLNGPKPVPLVAAEHLSFSYPSAGIFATVRVEQMPTGSFEEGKKALLDNFDAILASGDDSARNMSYALRPRLNGFEVYGLDRRRLEGNTLGIYLLFDNRTHVVASVYFLNNDVSQKKFATMAQWAALRDEFLAAYTGCVHAPRAATPSPKPETKKRR